MDDEDFDVHDDSDRRYYHRPRHGREENGMSDRPHNQTHAFRLTIICLISPIACAGLRPLGQVLAQFMMVWQR